MTRHVEPYTQIESASSVVGAKDSVQYSDLLPSNAHSLEIVRGLKRQTDNATVDGRSVSRSASDDPLFTASTNIYDEYDRFKVAKTNQSMNEGILNVVGDLFIPFKGGSDMASYRIDAMDQSRSEHEILRELRLLPPSLRSSLSPKLVDDLTNNNDISSETQRAIRTLLSQHSDSDFSKSKAIADNVNADLERFHAGVKDQNSYTTAGTIIGDSVTPLKAESDMAWYRIQALDRQNTENALIKELKLLSPKERAALPGGTIQDLLSCEDFSDTARKEFANLLSPKQTNYSSSDAVAQNIRSDFARFNAAIEDQKKDSSLLNVIGDVALSILEEFRVPGVLKTSSDMATYRIDELERQRSQRDIVKQIRALTREQRADLPRDLRDALLSNSDMTQGTLATLKQLLPSEAV
ncbi:MAG: hypothetical protein JST89_24250 [Cyanobacteria bacterium SZAS-4]|nr:hypothetical protein [Cyanobacteria bacterium SZAS-4]